MVYARQNKPTVVVGRHQNTGEEVNESFIVTKGIKVVQAHVRGGAVYHDLGT